MKDNRFTMLAVILTLILGGLLPAPAEGGLVESMKSALAMHDSASSLEEELAALMAMEQVSDANPESWRPAFWTAYLHTQVGRLYKMKEGTETSAEPKQHLEAAKEYLERAEGLLQDATAREVSSVHALQALVFQFEGWFGSLGSEQARDEARKALNASAVSDGDNPVLLVMVATGLISEGIRAENNGRVLAGRILLAEAKRRFEKMSSDRALTTNFNTEWVGFWMKRADENLGGVKSNGSP